MYILVWLLYLYSSLTLHCFFCFLLCHSLHWWKFQPLICTFIFRYCQNILCPNMERKFKQCWSTIPPISTKQTITSHLKSLTPKRRQHMRLEIQVLSWDRHKNIWIFFYWNYILAVTLCLYKCIARLSNFPSPPPYFYKSYSPFLRLSAKNYMKYNFTFSKSFNQR